MYSRIQLIMFRVMLVIFGHLTLTNTDVPDPYESGGNYHHYYGENNPLVLLPGGGGDKVGFGVQTMLEHEEHFIEEKLRRESSPGKDEDDRLGLGVGLRLWDHQNHHHHHVHGEFKHSGHPADDTRIPHHRQHLHHHQVFDGGNPNPNDDDEHHKPKWSGNITSPTTSNDKHPNKHPTFSYHRVSPPLPFRGRPIAAVKDNKDPPNPQTKETLLGDNNKEPLLPTRRISLEEDKKKWKKPSHNHHHHDHELGHHHYHRNHHHHHRRHNNYNYPHHKKNYYESWNGNEEEIFTVEE